MPVEFECLVCSAHEAKPFLLDCKDYYLGEKYRSNYYKCVNCGLVQQSPVPTDVGQFYKNYPVHQRKTSMFELARRQIMKPCYFDAKSLSAQKEAPLVLVDFGCGDGWFLDSLRDGQLVRVGYELDKDQADRLAKEINIPVFSNESELMAVYGGKVDVVTMHFVLEHITDFEQTFRFLHGLLKPSGILFVTVPNISSWEFKVFGRKWHNLDPPRHICFPQRRSIERISLRWGFELAKSFSVPFPNGFAGSVPVVIFGRFRFIAYLLALPLGVLISRLFPDGNQAYVLKRSERVGGG